MFDTSLNRIGLWLIASSFQTFATTAGFSVALFFYISKVFFCPSFDKQLMYRKITFRRLVHIKETTRLCSTDKKVPYKKFYYHPWVNNEFNKIFKLTQLSTNAAKQAFYLKSLEFQHESPHSARKEINLVSQYLLERQKEFWKLGQMRLWRYNKLRNNKEIYVKKKEIEWHLPGSDESHSAGWKLQ